MRKVQLKNSWDCEEGWRIAQGLQDRKLLSSTKGMCCIAPHTTWGEKN